MAIFNLKDLFKNAPKIDMQDFDHDENSIRGLIGAKQYGKLFIYRYVHINNLELFIKDNNTIRPNSYKLEGYTHIGLSNGVQRGRDAKSLTINEKTYSFKDAIPFFLCPKPPMLFPIKKGGDNVVKREMSEIVCIRYSIQTILDLKNIFCFCIGNFYYAEEVALDIDDLDKMPWEILGRIELRYESNPDEFQKNKNIKASEFIVFGDLPVDKIDEIFVYDLKSQQKVKSILPNHKVSEKSEWYP